MFNWQKAHRYYGFILILGSFLLWRILAVSYYDNRPIAQMKILYCALYDVDSKVCSSVLDEQAVHTPEEQELIDSLPKGHLPLIPYQNRLEEDLSVLKASGGGTHALVVLDSLKNIQEKIKSIQSHLDNNQPQATIHLFIILTGIALTLGLAGISTYFINRLLDRVLFHRWREAKNKLREEIKTSLSVASEWPKEEIGRFLVESSRIEKTIWSEDLGKFNNQVIDTRVGREGINWFDASKMLFNVAKICREEARDQYSKLENIIKRQYQRVRRIVWLEMLENLGTRLIPLVTFLGIYTALSAFTGGEPKDLTDNLMNGWNAVIFLTLGGWGAMILLLNGVRYLIRWWTERSNTELDDILVTVLSAPLSVSVFALSVFYALKEIPGYFRYFIMKIANQINDNKLLLFITAIIVTWLVVYVFNRVVIYILDQWARRTTQTYDDMFVKILQYFGTFIIIAGVGAITLTKFQSQITDLTGVDNILLPYSIFVSVITGIIGYSTKEGIENFFGGILLQVEPPFEKGDRLVLESGEITDVRGMGMRSTLLYNVLENTEISVPNKVMASQKITNLSRPDLQLRIPVTIQIPQDGFTLKRVEAALLDIAYFETEVDQARVSSEEVSEQQRRLGRLSLEEHAQKLFRTYDMAKNVLAERILGRGKTDSVPVYPTILNELVLVDHLRNKYGKIIENEEELIRQAMGEVSNEDVNKISKVLRDYSISIGGLAKEKQKKKNASQPDEILSYLLIEQGIKISVEAVKSLMICLAKFIRNASSTSIQDDGILKLMIRNNVENTTNKAYIRKHNLKSAMVIYSWYIFLARKRQALLMEISEHFGRVGEFLYSISNSNRDIKASIDGFVREFDKEPSVHSRFALSEDGNTYVEISFRVFATHLERRFEVMHKLHKDIQRNFKQQGLQIMSIWDRNN